MIIDASVFKFLKYPSLFKSIHDTILKGVLFISPEIFSLLPSSP